MRLDDLLATAEARIARLSPADAWAAAADSTLIVDIRDDGARERDGVVPASIHIPRTVLEWRLDLEGAWHNPHVTADRRLVMLCEHGYSSVLAAAAVADLGHAAVGDVLGGFDAWREAGLPVTRARPRPSGTLPGMDPPD